MKKLIYAFVMFVICVLVFTLISSRNAKPKNSPADEEIIFLINQVNNFDNLQISDLPSTVDYRGVYQYGSNYIIVGYGKVIEYNPETNSIIRQSDNDFGIVFDAAVIGDNLFVVIERPTTSHQNVYQIDLKTGKVIKQILPDGDYINTNVEAQDSLLWVSYWGGTAKHNPNTGLTTFYTNTQLGFDSDDCPRGVTNDNGAIKIICGLGTSVYNQKIDVWTYVFEPDKNYRSWDSDLTTLGYDFKLPKYMGFTKIDDYYLLIADDGIYQLKKGGFPVLYKEIKDIKWSDNIKKIVVSPDLTKLVIIGDIYSMGGGLINSNYNFGLIDLNKGVYYDYFFNSALKDEGFYSGDKELLIKLEKELDKRTGLKK